MVKQVIRKGDIVVFQRAHEHPRGDTRSFLVEEVLSGLTPVSGPQARIVAFGGEWQLRPLDALKHDPDVWGNQPTELTADKTFVEATVSPGFLGNPDHWCWWESEYPEDGCFGPYSSFELAIAAIEQLERDDPATHFHVKVADANAFMERRRADRLRRNRREGGSALLGDIQNELGGAAADQLAILNRLLEHAKMFGNVEIAGCSTSWQVKLTSYTGDAIVDYRAPTFAQSAEAALDAIAAISKRERP